MSGAMTSLERDFADALVKATGYEPRRAGDEWKGLCPVHGDKHPSLDFREEDGKILVTCRSRACSGESIFAALDWKPKATRDTFFDRPVRTRFAYTDENGSELVQKIRFDDSDEPGKKCSFSKKLHGKKLPLYRIRDVLAAVRDGITVYVCEGEKDADTLHALGLVGTSAPLGAVTGKNVSGKWLDAYTAALAGADVVLLQDADEAGTEHMKNVSRLLAGRVKSLRIVPPFPGGKGCDVSDSLVAHGREETLAFIEKAEEPKSTAEAAPEALVTPAANHKEPENGAKLLSDLSTWYRRFVVLKVWQADALALWTLHTHALPVTEPDATPYLVVKSPEPECGKTRLLETAQYVVREAWYCISPSEAVTYRYIEKAKPTMLLDEADTIFNKKSDVTEGLRALLNGGNRRSASVPRCKDKGGDVQLFSIFCPKMIAVKGDCLPDTVLSRSFIIIMKRKTAADRIERMRARLVAPEGAKLAERARAFVARNADAIRDTVSALPEALAAKDRLADSAEPLLAIADVAGGEWPKRGREALVSFLTTAETGTSSESLGILLLRDVAAILKGDVRHAVPMAELHEKLVKIEDSPWPRYHKSDPLSIRRMGEMLRGFVGGAKPVKVLGAVAKGYHRADLEDAIGRYVPPEPKDDETPPVTLSVTPSVTPEPTPLAEARLPRLPGLLDEERPVPIDVFGNPRGNRTGNRDDEDATEEREVTEVTQVTEGRESHPAPVCYRCTELENNRRAGSRNSDPCDVCGAARPLLRRSVGL